MKYCDLRDFIAQLQAMGELCRIDALVSTRLEMTEICDRVLRAGRPGASVHCPRAIQHAGAQSVYTARAGWR